MITKQKRERYIWLFFLVGSILLWKVLIPAQIQTNANSNSSFGPDFFPSILAILILIISGISFISTFFIKETKTEGETNSEEGGKPVAGIIVFLITVFYSFIIDYFHFIIASIICMFVIMWVLSVRKWYLYVIMVAFIFLVNFIFEDIMYINLP
ncbi:tripartite tricarboxylate transporter TctB family protein [Paucisalibacillus sp. EB02]|uniref:tripartite tricarboxylate transporter TctB family protein n=1 Tax=Paucisalibacillus sp. EB02 TaxID=1347087 RepID=UPI0004AED72F|nr:tripartite tricarboxylate transporter TctB family protein [Paucisalibacillus sp. EB02]